MEKFSQWRDAGTGIAPFLPNSLPIGARSESALVSTALAVLSGFVTIPFLTLSSLLYFAIFQWIPVVGPLFLRYVVLIALRVWKIDLSSEADKRNKQVPRPKAGDVIVSNFVSPLDSVVYSAIFGSVTFVIPSEGQSENEFVELSMLGASYAARCTAAKRSPGSDLAKLVSSAKAAGKIVVLFAEGTTSNGRGLLPWAVKLPLDSLPAGTSLFPSSVKFTPPVIATPLPINFFSWLWIVLGQIQGFSSRVRLAAAIDTSTKSATALNAEVSDSICRVGRLKKLGDYLGISGKRSFLEAWKKGR